MGYALFTARKMSLQAKVNDYNAKLMQLSNEETRLANQTANRQQMRNAQDNAHTVGTQLFQGVGTIGGAIAGLALGGPVGAVIGAVAGKEGTSMATGAGNNLRDGMRKQEDDAYAAAMNAKQKQIDTEKQRLTTLLNAAQNELQQVEKAEEGAIKNSTPKYVA